MQDPLLTILKTSFNQSDRTGLHAQRIISENNLKSGDRTTNSSVVSSWCISHFSIGKDTSQLLTNDYFHGWFKGKHHIYKHLRNSETNGASIGDWNIQLFQKGKHHFWYQGTAAPGALVFSESVSAGILSFDLTIPEAYLKWIENMLSQTFRMESTK